MKAHLMIVELLHV